MHTRLGLFILRTAKARLSLTSICSFGLVTHSCMYITKLVLRTVHSRKRYISKLNLFRKLVRLLTVFNCLKSQQTNYIYFLGLSRHRSLSDNNWFIAGTTLAKTISWSDGAISMVILCVILSYTCCDHPICEMCNQTDRLV